MLNRFLPMIAAAFALAAVALSPQPAAASWMSAPAAAANAAQADLSNVTEVRRRSHRHHFHRHGWGPRAFFHQPFYGFHSFHAYPRRCGYVWNHRWYRHVWVCW